jgi:uncharacterized membrane protein
MERRMGADAPVPDRQGHGAALAASGRDTGLLQWRLRRNCALDPRQTMHGFVALCAFNSLVGAAFAMLGYPLVMGFVVIVHGGFAIALLAYARHAGDCETVTLYDDGQLTVEQQCGARLTRTDFHAAWVRVMAQREARGMVCLCEQRVSVQVGRHVQPHLRARLAQELRHALAERAGCMPARRELRHHARACVNSGATQMPA